MLTKENLRKPYLLLSAALVLFGITLGITGSGQIHLLPGIATGSRFYFRALYTFTYQSNLLLVLGFLVMAVLKSRKAGLYISVAVMLATSVTGLVYNLLLVPFAGAPMFFSSYVNFSTHILAMALALVNYFAFECKGFLNYRHILAAMIFPAVYWIVFVNIGERIDFFPYFFMNHTEIGWAMVLLWLVGLLVALVGLGLLIVLYDKVRGKMQVSQCK